jgi:S1-C subfamily serine protease
VAEELRIDMDTRGVVVVDVESGSTAENFGLRKGDIVLTVNNIKIETTRDLVQVLSQPSRVWRLTIRRGERQYSYGG